MRGMRIVAPVLILVGPVAAGAAPPSTPATAVAKSVTAAAKPATPAGQTPITIKRVPMSQEGNAIVARINASPDTRLQQVQTELRGLTQTNLQFVTGGPIDLEKLDASLRRETALITEMRGRQNDRLMMILRALSESDRIAYLQRSIKVTQAPNAAGQTKPQGAVPATVAPPAAKPPAAPPASGR